MKKIEKTVFVLLLSISINALMAQEAIPASGSNATGSGGTASYTVGQVVYTTNTGTNGSVAQGVQQPYEIFVITGIDNRMNINLACKVYPNPSTTYLTLEIENSNDANLIYQLFNTDGKLMEDRKVESDITDILMETFPSATYFLRVMQSSQGSSMIEIKSFKIVKH